LFFSWDQLTILSKMLIGQIVGRVSIRHELNAFLTERGGHIGYGVRPEFRGRGYATAILLEALGIIHNLGVQRVLVTCDDANIASSRVIEKCGGVLENIIEIDGGEPLRRYWIAPPQS
jgi:predicted acetyltransferase